jgi:serine phosphatase RsbU (regulator of sigma subunit)
MNTLLYREGSGMFATCVYGVLDLGTRRLRAVNAGHNFPLLLRADGTCEKLPSTGVPLGLLPAGLMPFTDQEALLRRGDALVLYTDGVPEAARADGEQFGDDRLEALICGSRGLSADALRQRIYDEVLSFIGDAHRSDDITVMVIKAL